MKEKGSTSLVPPFIVRVDVCKGGMNMWIGAWNTCNIVIAFRCAAEPPPKVSTTAKLPLQFAPKQFE